MLAARIFRQGKLLSVTDCCFRSIPKFRNLKQRSLVMFRARASLQAEDQLLSVELVGSLADLHVWSWLRSVRPSPSSWDQQVIPVMSASQ